MLTFKHFIYNTVHKGFLLFPLKLPKSTMADVSSSYKFLNQNEAINLDQELFNDYRFSVDQLMELAGLSVAIAIAKVFPLNKNQNVLILCGPGNNGGDGLVAARHLTQFGYNSSIYYPKQTPKPLYQSLVNQCVKSGVNVLNGLPESLDSEYQVLVDALFGFSFKPPVREEFKPLMEALISTSLPVASVDIPSGWDVNSGPPQEPHIKPKLLISLSAPKLCAQYVQNGRHFLGGRFIPKAMQQKYDLKLPPYPGTEQVVELENK